MAEPITLQKLVSADADADTLGEFANEDKVVVSRKGLEYPSAPMASRLLVENGLLGATPFSTYADMADSALSNGDYAVVTGDLDAAKNGVYQKADGVWLLSEYNPSIQLTNEMEKIGADYNQVLHDDEGRVYVFSLSDGEKVGFGVTDDLKLVLEGHELSSSHLPLNIMDINGQSALAVAKDGRVYIPNLVTNLFADYKTSSSIKHLANAKWADINHIVGYGQSLSRGAATYTPISTTQPYNNVMLKSGVKIKYVEDGYDPSDFSPLIETVTAQEGSNAESPTSGNLNEISRRIDASGANPSDYVFLGTQSGHGGTTITQLSGGYRYSALERHIQDSKAIADSKGLTYTIPAITFIQGETDSKEHTTYMEYYQKMTDLMDRIRNLCMDTSGQDTPPFIFTYQTSGHRSYDSDSVSPAKVQRRLSIERDDVCLVAPAYAVPHYLNNVHLTAEGSWMLGAYFGRAIYQTLVVGKKWRPLEPIDVSWSADTIDIKYHVPIKPIQLSTVVNAQVPNEGFDIWTADSVLIADAISSVVVLSDDTIRININPVANIPTDAFLSFAKGRDGDDGDSPMGNVVDSHGLYDIVISPTGEQHPLYNASILFEYNRNFGL